MILKTKFDLYQTVKINELNKSGRILAIYISETGVSYSIRYFMEGSPNTVYFYEDEISEVIEEKILGFKTEKV